MAGWSSQNRQSGRENKPRIYEEMDFYQFPPNKWISMRAMGPIHSYAEGWMKVKKKDKTISKPFPKLCLDYNPKTQKYDRNTKKDKNGKRKVVEICPYRKGGLYIAQSFIENFIIRDLQKDEPRRKAKPQKSESRPQEMLGEKWYIKKMGSDTWTPARVIRIPSSLGDQLASLEELNVHNGKSYPLNHPRYGMDVKIRYNPKGTGSGKWSVQVGKATRLKEEELKYPIYKLDVPSLVPETKEEAEKNWETLKDRIYLEDKDGKNKKKSKSKGDDDDDDDDDLEEKKSRRSKSKSKSSKSSKSSKNKSGKKKKKSYDDLDEFDV